MISLLRSKQSNFVSWVMFFPAMFVIGITVHDVHNVKPVYLLISHINVAWGRFAVFSHFALLPHLCDLCSLGHCIIGFFFHLNIWRSKDTVCNVTNLLGELWHLEKLVNPIHNDTCNTAEKLVRWRSKGTAILPAAPLTDMYVSMWPSRLVC